MLNYKIKWEYDKNCTFDDSKYKITMRNRHL